MFDLLEIKNEEIGGCRFFSIRQGTGWPVSYQKRVLEEGCKGLLAMRFIENKEETLIYYKNDSYLRLSDYLTDLCINKKIYEKNVTAEILRLLAGVISCVLDSEDRLLSTECLPFSSESIFVQHDSGEVRLAYLPHYDEGRDAQKMILDLIKSINCFCEDEQWKIYAADLLEEITAFNRGYSELLKYLNLKARDIHLRGWPKEGLERSRVFETEAELESKDLPESSEIELPQKQKRFAFVRR